MTRRRKPEAGIESMRYFRKETYLYQRAESKQTRGRRKKRLH